MNNVLVVRLVNNTGEEPKIQASKAGDGTPELAIDMTGIIKLLTIFGPIILQIFSGGFSVATITALIQAILSMTGMSANDIEQIQKSIA